MLVASEEDTGTMAKRLIMIGIDGCHRDTLYRMINAGTAPFFTRLAENGTMVKDAATMFPATTISCCTSLFTGCWYKNTGILDNEWMDRFATPAQGKSYIAGMKYALDSMDRKLFGLPTIFLPDLKTGGAVNNDIKEPTIYEEFTRAGKTSYTFFHYIGKGATKWVKLGRGDMIRYAMVDQLEKPYQFYEKTLVPKALKQCRKKMPDLLSLWFGGHDGHGHRHGVEGHEDYLRDFINPQLEKLEAGLKAIVPNDELYWTIVADHGQTTMPKELINRCMWYEDFYPICQNAGYQNVSWGYSDMDIEPMDVVVTFGNGNKVGLYVKDRASKNWKTQPDYEKDIVPVLNNALKAKDRIEPFSSWEFPGYLDFLLTRKKFDEPYGVYVNKPPYDGAGTIVPLAEYFKGKTKYVKPIERISGADSPKNADILIVLDDENFFNINTRDGWHPGQHGSLMPSDSHVPMIFSGPGIKKGEIPEAFTIDWAPTAAAMVGVTMPRANGKVLPVL